MASTVTPKVCRVRTARLNSACRGRLTAGRARFYRNARRAYRWVAWSFDALGVFTVEGYGPTREDAVAAWKNERR